MSDMSLTRPSAEYLRAMGAEAAMVQGQMAVGSKNGFATVEPTGAVGSQSASFRKEFNRSLDSFNDNAGEEVGQLTAEKNFKLSDDLAAERQVGRTLPIQIS